MEKCCIGKLIIEGEAVIGRYRLDPPSTPLLSTPLGVQQANSLGFLGDRYTQSAYVTGGFTKTTKTICDASSPDCSPGDDQSCISHVSKYESVTSARLIARGVSSGPIDVNGNTGFPFNAPILGSQSRSRHIVSFKYVAHTHLGCCTSPCPDKVRIERGIIKPYAFNWEPDREYWVASDGTIYYDFEDARAAAEPNVWAVPMNPQTGEYMGPPLRPGDRIPPEYFLNIPPKEVFMHNDNYDGVVAKIILEAGIGGSAEPAVFETCCGGSNPPDPIGGSTQGRKFVPGVL